MASSHSMWARDWRPGSVLLSSRWFSTASHRDMARAARVPQPRASMARIEIRNVTKVFGRNEAAGLALARQGVAKLDILARTGCGLGLHDVSLEIPNGEIFV